MVETPIERVTREAWANAASGMRPDTAWKKALEVVYPEGKLRAQLQHTCPKWAFSMMCQTGNVRDVPAGSCPEAESMRSAAFAVAALDLLRKSPDLIKDKRRLKEAIFGAPNSPSYRRPNHEVEVILALLKFSATLLNTRPASGK